MTNASPWWRRVADSVADRLPKSITDVAAPHDEPPDVLRRRRLVVAGTSVAGVGLLGVSLTAKPGSGRFYVLTFGAAGAYTLGGLLSGPLHRGWIGGRDDRLRRPVLAPVATGVAAFGFFYGSALVARRIPFLARAIGGVLQFADQGSMPLVALTTYANGIGEEVFFRGALYAALPHRQAVIASTGVYALATTATRNPSLVLASAVMGVLWGMQRQASGGLQAPMLTHLTWSTLMLRYMPPLFRTEPEVAQQEVAQKKSPSQKQQGERTSRSGPGHRAGPDRRCPATARSATGVRRRGWDADDPRPGALRGKVAVVTGRELRSRQGDRRRRWPGSAPPCTSWSGTWPRAGAPSTEIRGEVPGAEAGAAPLRRVRPGLGAGLRGRAARVGRARRRTRAQRGHHAARAAGDRRRARGRVGHARARAGADDRAAAPDARRRRARGWCW